MGIVGFSIPTVPSIEDHLAIATQAPYSVPVEATTSPVVAFEWTRESMEAYVVKRAAESNVNTDVVKKVIACESRWNPNAIGDHGNSYGLVQIYMPVWGKEITVSQAKDPKFAIDFLIQKLSEGQGKLWTCWRNLK